MKTSIEHRTRRSRKTATHLSNTNTSMADREGHPSLRLRILLHKPNLVRVAVTDPLKNTHKNKTLGSLLCLRVLSQLRSDKSCQIAVSSVPLNLDKGTKGKKEIVSLLYTLLIYLGDQSARSIKQRSWKTTYLLASANNHSLAARRISFG